MFFGFGKKKEEKQTGTYICLNESLLQTKDQEVIRCLNIQAHFNTKDEESAKQATHDMVRQCLITTGHTIESNDAVSKKEQFEEAVSIEINRAIAELPFLCDKVTIESIGIVEGRR